MVPELPPCYVKKKVVPPKVTTFLSQSDDPHHDAHQSDLLWVLARYVTPLPQTVPGWKGWLSCTGKRGVEASTILEYLPPIPAPITENSIVQEHLVQAMAMSTALGQSWTIITFDMAASKKTYQIIWQYPVKFEKVFIRLGVFHTFFIYAASIFKSMEGSRIEQIIIHTDLCASGSITSVLNCKHYSQCRFVMKTLTEALSRLFLEQFEKYKGTIEFNTKQQILSLGKIPSCSNLKECFDSSSVRHLLQNIKKFEIDVQRGALGKTGQAWMNLMNKIWTGLEFLRATSENNLDLHISCLRKMCVTFFNQDLPNYARKENYA